MRFEEFFVGQVLNLGPIRVEQSDIIAFASAYDPQWFHTDPARALSSRWQGIIASGWHACAIVALYEKGELQACDALHAFKDVPVELDDNWVSYAGYGKGGEGSDWVWALFGHSFAARDSADYIYADNIVKWGITGDPNASVMTMDPTEYAAQYRALSDVIDSTDPDLSGFYGHGGKLIVWYGASDACVSYKQTVRYIQSVEKKLGGDVTRRFLRFYVSPATGHAMGGGGASSEPLLSALVDWVEKGHAPGTLASTLSQGSADPGGTRPLCQYPLFPRYRGRGNPDLASSFVCSKP